MINYLIFQIVICHIVVLIDGENRWKKRGVVDCRYLAKTTGSSTLTSSTYIVFVTKMQKGKPSKKDLPYSKTISQLLNWH